MGETESAINMLDSFTVLLNTTTGAPDTCSEDYNGYTRSSVNIWSLVAVIIFYLVILVIGVLASYCKGGGQHDTEEIMVAGRNIGMVVGIFTMTATWVGGGYINGTAEYVFKPHKGLLWTQAPWGYALSLLLGGFLFAKRMRDRNYVTMLDPFQQEYGRVVAALCYIPAFTADVLWSAAILAALGSTLTVIVGIPKIWSIITSAAIAVMYTLVGGLYSVAYTDVVQLGCIFVGLWLAVPFALRHEHVTPISATAQSVDGTPGWLGHIESNWTGYYIDTALLLMFGGIPWQAYFQRVLSQKTALRAQILSFVAAFGCFVMAVPAVLLGAVAFSTDWAATGYGKDGCVVDGIIHKKDYTLTLPLVMHYLTPLPVAVIGLGAVSAAVMSSADSSVLSASSMFTRNIYAPFRNAIGQCCGKKEASERELTWILRLAVVLTAACACTIGILVDSVYGLWHLCGDLVYVILFPELLLVLYFPYANAYGASIGLFIGLFFRLSGGEPILGFKPFISYPLYDEVSGQQLLPFKTICMVLTMVIIMVVSLLTHWMFKSVKVPKKYDCFGAFASCEPEDFVYSNGKDPANGHHANGSAQDGCFSIDDASENLMNPGFSVGKNQLELKPY